MLHMSQLYFLNVFWLVLRVRPSAIHAERFLNYNYILCFKIEFGKNKKPLSLLTQLTQLTQFAQFIHKTNNIQRLKITIHVYIIKYKYHELKFWRT